MSPAVELVGAEALADLAALEPTAEQVFGRGDRRAGWFARKLIREGVEPRLSSLAVIGSGGSGGPADVRGYALLGRAPSLGDVARGAGVGVVAPLRGRGLGRRLVEHASARAHAAGCAAVEFLAEPERLAWYRDQGFAVVDEQVTLIAAGTGPATATWPDAAAPKRDDAAAMWSWIPEIWARTDVSERAFVEHDGARLWLTREGRAWLAHRCEVADRRALKIGLEALRRQLPRGTPLLLYPCPAASDWIAELGEAGFAPVQRSFVVRRGTQKSG